MDTQNAEYWDGWWRKRISDGKASAFPMFPAPILEYGGRRVDPNSNELLVSVMIEHGLRTVLCAGNGVSQEPRLLAAAGFDVTALDMSPVATQFAEAFHDDVAARSGFFRGPQMHRPGGSVKFVAGDLLDLTACPGPFDVVIERRTVQVLPEQQWGPALSALSERLGPVGILVSLCLDDPFPMELGWSQPGSRGLFHASQSWFEEQGWTIWDGVPNSALTGRVGWLIRVGSMKPGPRRKEGGGKGDG
jgi:SAM-dependent methyltransferase